MPVMFPIASSFSTKSPADVVRTATTHSHDAGGAQLVLAED